MDEVDVDVGLVLLFDEVLWSYIFDMVLGCCGLVWSECGIVVLLFFDVSLV